MFNYKPRKTSKSKMGNTKITIDGIKFDSKLEARFYWAIKYHQDCKLSTTTTGIGIVTDIENKPQYKGLKYLGRQDRIELLPKINKIRAVHYVSDFQIMYNDKIYYVDAKGRETDVFKLKMNLYKRLKNIPDLIVAKTIGDMMEDLQTLNKK
jgi:Protein of unknown function (DUF1064)